MHPFEPVLNNARALLAREAAHQRNEVHRQHGEQGVCEPCRAHGEQRREQPLPRHLGVEVDQHERDQHRAGEADLGFRCIVASEKEAPNMLANMG